MKMNGLCFLAATLVASLTLRTPAAPTTPTAPLDTFVRLPIKEITVFKDGHAFVAHEGIMPTDEHGQVVMDYLPAPVLGTLWPYSVEKRAPLTSVVAGTRRVLVERTALSVHELLEANIGAEVLLPGDGTNRYPATIAGIPARDSRELASTSPLNTPEKLPEKGNLILLKTAEGLKVFSLDRISDFTFKGTHKSTLASEEFRNLLTLKLDWGKAKPAKTAHVGLFYLQKGVRWIPNYKIELDGKGHAVVKFQATLLNELADLDDVSVNLVIGVPTFAFKDTVDPLALQQDLAHLSQYFQTDNPRNSPLALNFSNAIMSQQARASDFRASTVAAASSLGPEMGDGGGKTEDLFIFNVPHVTLRKGERMVFPIAEFTLPYQDVFTLELPFAPPAEVRRNFGNDQQRELAKLFNAPKVLHKIRLTNNSKYPLTTAPALLLREGRVLAQGMMTYTASGAHANLAVTTAVDISVKKSETETKRTPNALTENGNTYSRIDLAGKVTLTSYRAQPVEVEVTRFVLGTADSAGRNGKVEKLNSYDDENPGDYPYWWSWYGWPNWWSYLNGVGRLTWTAKLEPKEACELDYDWHYFWR